MRTKTLRYKVKFITPAFLGNAEQKGQWRTPPFKALLRQWWRVAYAKTVDYDVNRLRAAEARLFGSASDEGNGKSSGKSRVRLRLEEWKKSSLEKWQSQDIKVFHKEVGSGGRKIGSQLYLGYGPLEYNKEKGVALRGTKDGKPITYMTELSAIELKISVPDNCEELRFALQLINWFGTIGGRSRNGWGSFMLASHEGTEEFPKFPDTRSELERHLGNTFRPLTDCLELDWPHAIGTDDRGPLVWKTESHDRWEDVMKDLAEIKIAFRTALPFRGANTAEDRHILSYPVTNHNVLGNNERLANQVRFKVIQERDKCTGLIFQLPTRCPLNGTGHINQYNVWRKVQGILDSECSRIS